MDEIERLIEDYANEYNKDKHPFLLFELAHVKENDHTRVLKSILCFNNYQFLPSFLERIGVPYNSKRAKVDYITDQEKAAGNKGTGFVDLFINIGRKKVIIENKICGATDTECQLARYIATACGIDIKNQKVTTEICESWKDGKPSNYIHANILKNIHVIYLTADGNKTPSSDSLPNYFRNVDESGNEEYKFINYNPVNYAYDIIPWLEDDVLPNVPFLDDGIMIAGIRQYIASLKDRYIPIKSSKCVKKIVDDIKKKEKDSREQYKAIDNVKKELNKKVKGSDSIDNELIGKIQGELSENMKSLFSAPDGWKLYFTPSFILLYKDEWWSEFDRKKNYNFPSIHMFCSPTDNFIYGNNSISWCIKGVRIPGSEIIEGTTYKRGWELKGRDLVKNLGIKDKANECGDDYFKDFVSNIEQNSKIQDTVKRITDLIRKAKANNKPYHVALMEEVRNKK